MEQDLILAATTQPAIELATFIGYIAYSLIFLSVFCAFMWAAPFATVLFVVFFFVWPPACIVFGGWILLVGGIKASSAWEKHQEKQMERAIRERKGARTIAEYNKFYDQHGRFF